MQDTTILIYINYIFMDINRLSMIEVVSEEIPIDAICSIPQVAQRYTTYARIA